MSSLSDIDKRYLESIMEMSGGYVLDYNDATFGEFFRRHGVNIHGTKYLYFGTSKAKKMRAFWMREPDALVGRVLAEMLDSYEAKCILSGQEIDRQILEKVRTIVGRLLGEPQKADPPKAIEGFLREEFVLPDMRNLPVEPAVVPVIEQRIHEARAALKAGAYLAVVVLCGSILEGVLLGSAQKDPKQFQQVWCKSERTR